MEPKKQKFQQIPGSESSDLFTDWHNDFKSMLINHKIDEELADEIVSQFNSGVEGEIPNLIFVFTEGEYAVTGIHVPESALDGKDGPVLMQGSSPRHIIAAFSQAKIRNTINLVDWKEQTAGLPGISDVSWADELEKLVELVKIEMQENPPVNWAEELGN